MDRAGTMEPPIAAGTLLALLSALLFGASTPAVQRLGRGLGPFSAAGVLFAGAALFAAGGLASPRGAAGPHGRVAGVRRAPPLRARHLPRLVAVAIAGALLAPAALAWGLSR